MPTAQRAPAALLVRRGGERLLFDCAEGTQRQLQRSTVGLPDLEEIFLTHYHADHVLGLPGMLKTVELAPGEALDRGEYRLETFAVDHGVSAVGYALVERDRPGRFDVAAADALGVPPGQKRGKPQG